MENKDILINSINVIKRAEFAVLTTLNARRQPDTCAMMNLRNTRQYPALVAFFEDDSPATFLTTNTSSAKIRHIQNNPTASIYYFVPDTIEGVTLIGALRPVSDKAVLNGLWQEDWAAAYPGGRDGGDYSILQFIPETLKFYDGNFGKHALRFARNG